MVKLGQIRTLEATLAIVLTVAVVLTLVTLRHKDNPPIPKLTTIQYNILRPCVLAHNTTCIKELLSTYIPQHYNFIISLDTPIVSLNDTTTIDIIRYNYAGNYSIYKPTTLFIGIYS